MSDTNYRCVDWTTCPHCGKRSYASRKDARLVARRHRTGGTVMRAYPCHQDAERWHVGHMSAATRRGADYSTSRR